MATKSFANAIKWSYIGTWGEKGFSAFFTFFLAAWLGPRDFGAVSIAVVYVSFLQMILDQGFAAALIQKSDLDDEHLDAVFWFNVGLSLIVVVVSFLLSGWWAGVNHAPQAAQIISFLSLCIPIEAFAIVQRSILSRQMDFRSLTVRSNVAVIAGGIAGFAVAFAGKGLWALVAQQIVRDITSVILLWRLSAWRPKARFSWRHLSDLSGFSVSMFIGQLGIFADAYGSSIILGLFFGPEALGLYRLAERTVNTVLVATTSSIQAVSLPEFSRYQKNKEMLRSSVLTCVRLSSIVSMPALSLIASVSVPLMLVLGAKWVPAVPALRVLCMLGICLVLTYFTGPLLQALAKVKLAAMLEWCRTILGIVLLTAAGYKAIGMPVSMQVVGIAGTRLILVGFIVLPVFLFLLMRISKISMAELLRSISPPIVASLGIVVSVSAFQWIMPQHLVRPIFLLLGESLLGVLVGFSILLGLDPRFRQSALKIVPGNLALRASR